MDYTTSANVKASFNITETSDDALIAVMITRASRAIDRLCAGAVTGSDDYFTLGTVNDEMPAAIIDARNRLVVYPHKQQIISVSALSYRTNPRDTWHVVDATDITVSGLSIIAWITLERQMPFQARVSYSGGLSATTDALPADLIEAATVLAGRYYREAQAGVTDVVGVAELGVLKYAKAMPARVELLLQPYRRVLPW